MTGTEMEGGQIANCWVEASKDGSHLWAANALSSSISLYDVGSDGSLSLANEIAYKADAEDIFFSDLYLSRNGSYLNQLIGNTGEIIVFKVGSDGSLEILHHVKTDLPAVGAYGILTI